MSVPTDMVVNGGEDDGPPPTPYPSEDTSRDSADREDGSEGGNLEAPPVIKGTDKDNVSQPKQFVKEDDDEGKKKRRALIGLCCCCLMLIVFLVILILFFTPDTGGAARAFEDTLSPTIFATDAPTTFIPPTVDEETNSPSVIATEAPTIQSDALISRLPCSEIRVQDNVTTGNFGENNFKNFTFGDKQICGDTYGPDPDKPDRNPWSVRYGRRNCPMRSYEGMVELCNFVGARLCTSEEYFAEVSTATGCGGDRFFVWTSTECRQDGEEGQIMFDLGLRDARKPFTECVTDLSTQSVMRCCGDNY